MVSIGLTGNIASGKSHIAHIFASLGVAVQDSDKVAHDILQGDARAEIEKEFGTIDRKKLGSIVFADNAKLKKLESILHPKVRQRNLDFIKTHPLSLIEIPLLFETKAEEIFDFVIYVDVNEGTQKKRALARGGVTLEKLEHILSQQHKISPQQKRQMANFVIDNNEGSDTLGQIKQIMEKLCAK